MVTEIISWIRKQMSFWIRTIIVKTLTTGQIPKHVALMMDGNRRYASQMGITVNKANTIG